MSGVPPPVAEYVDAAGNTWQLTAEQARRRGFEPAAKAVPTGEVEDKVIDSSTTGAAARKPATSRRRTTTK